MLREGSQKEDSAWLRSVWKSMSGHLVTTKFDNKGAFCSTHYDKRSVDVVLRAMEQAMLGVSWIRFEMILSDREPGRRYSW